MLASFVGAQDVTLRADEDSTAHYASPWAGVVGIEAIRSQLAAEERQRCTFRPAIRIMPPSLTRRATKRFLLRSTSSLKLCDMLHEDHRVGAGDNFATVAAIQWN